MTHLVRVLEGPAVDAVVRGVELALGEPSNVSLLEAAVPDSLEGDIPVNRLASELYGKESWSKGGVSLEN